MNHLDNNQGTKCEQAYSETQWVEWILGQADLKNAAAMEQHLQECSVCSRTVEEWSALLMSKKDESGSRAAVPLFPSERHRRSLRKEVQRIGFRRRLAGKPSLWGSIAACAIVILLLIGLKRTVSEPDPIGGYVQRHEPSAVTVIHNPETAAYRADRSSNLGGSGSGYVWLNGRTQEAFVLVDGLPSRSRLDYQAWALRKDRCDSMGLFKMDEGLAHLYVKAGFLAGADHIAVGAKSENGSYCPPSKEAIVVFLLNPS